MGKVGFEPTQPWGNRFTVCHDSPTSPLSRFFYACFRLTLQRKYSRPQSFFVPQKIFIFCAKNIKLPRKQWIKHARGKNGQNNEKVKTRNTRKTKLIEINNCNDCVYCFSLGWGSQVLTKHKSEFSNPLICPILTSRCVANISGGSLSCQPTIVTLQPKREKS